MKIWEEQGGWDACNIVIDLEEKLHWEVERWLLIINLLIKLTKLLFFLSVQFSHSVVSDSLQPHELQQARPPCPPPTLGVHPTSCPSSRWCHPAISSSVVPFFSCPQSFPARDHSVVFEIASNYCISDSFVDHDGYSISSKGFLPTVVDIKVIWVKFTHSSPF